MFVCVSRDQYAHPSHCTWNAHAHTGSDRAAVLVRFLAPLAFFSSSIAASVFFTPLWRLGKIDRRKSRFPCCSGVLPFPPFARSAISKERKGCKRLIFENYKARTKNPLIAFGFYLFFYVTEMSSTRSRWFNVVFKQTSNNARVQSWCEWFATIKADRQEACFITFYPFFFSTEACPTLPKYDNVMEK